MNSLRLKIFGLVVLVLAVSVGVYSLWPGESPPAEQVEKQGETVPKPQANARQSTTNADSSTGRSGSTRLSESEKRKVEQIARTADSLIVLYRNPGSPEAAKARQSLLKLPARINQAIQPRQQKIDGCPEWRSLVSR